MGEVRSQFAADALQGKTILLTGAASGMAREASLLAGRAGANVIVTARHDYDEVAALIRAEGGQADGHYLDVTRAEDWDRVIDAVIGKYGRIDGFANIAGVNTPEDSLLNEGEGNWDMHILVNLTGPYLGLKRIIPHMLEHGGGKVVNVSSVCAIIGIPNTMAYSAAKAGLSGLARQIAMEFASQGLRINTISPGVINSPIHEKTKPETLETAKAAIPVKDMGMPRDIASMVIYLLGAGSDFITGQDFVIDGGWTVSY